MTGMLGPLQTKWVEALESKKFQQTDGVLFDGQGYCCLGVACEIAGLKPIRSESSRCFNYEDESVELPDNIIELYGFRGPSGDTNDRNGMRCLANMNDEGQTFVEIAAEVRASPEAFFREPK